MKKILKIGLYSIGSVCLLIVLFFGWYMIKAKSELKIMTPLETKEIVTNVFSVNDSFVNLFLINNNNQYIAIDAGTNIDNILEELKKININPDNVVAVLLTHTDGDHVAALSLFKNATIYFSEQEEQHLNGKKSRFLFFGNSIDSEDYVLLKDKEQLNIGNTTIQAILTPGHTIGSMCYLINDSCLFVGDVLSLKEGKIEPFNDFFNMDSQTASLSISNVTNLPSVKYIFTAHYGYTGNYSSAIKDWNLK